MITSDIILISTCFVLLYFNFASSHLEITELRGPTAIESGSVNEIILDCDFKVSNESGVVVKWFYNGQVDQIYQWLVGSDKPYPMGSLREHIDSTFRISDDPRTKYRAIKLINVSHELSGSYTCKVGGYDDEKFQTKNLTIFVPPSDGLQLTVDEEDLSALCSVSGVYPEPKVWLQVLQSNFTSADIEDEEENISIDENTMFFNKTTTLIFTNETLSKPGKFVCEMTIPGTSYALTETKSISVDKIDDPYFPLATRFFVNKETENYSNKTNALEEDNSSNQPNPSAFMLHTSLLLLFSIILKY